MLVHQMPLAPRRSLRQLKMLHRFSKCPQRSPCENHCPEQKELRERNGEILSIGQYQGLKGLLACAREEMGGKSAEEPQRQGGVGAWGGGRYSEATWDVAPSCDTCTCLRAIANRRPREPASWVLPEPFPKTPGTLRFSAVASSQN